LFFFFGTIEGLGSIFNMLFYLGKIIQISHLTAQHIMDFDSTIILVH
jgi:hypothetical protein